MVAESEMHSKSKRRESKQAFEKERRGKISDLISQLAKTLPTGLLRTSSQVEVLTVSARVLKDFSSVRVVDEKLTTTVNRLKSCQELCAKYEKWLKILDISLEATEKDIFDIQAKLRSHRKNAIVPVAEPSPSEKLQKSSLEVDNISTEKPIVIQPAAGTVVNSYYVVVNNAPQRKKKTLPPSQPVPCRKIAPKTVPDARSEKSTADETVTFVLNINEETADTIQPIGSGGGCGGSGEICNTTETDRFQSEKIKSTKSVVPEDSVSLTTKRPGLRVEDLIAASDLDSNSHITSPVAKPSSVEQQAVVVPTTLSAKPISDVPKSAHNTEDVVKQHVTTGNHSRGSTSVETSSCSVYGSRNALVTNRQTGIPEKITASTVSSNSARLSSNEAVQKNSASSNTAHLSQNNATASPERSSNVARSERSSALYSCSATADTFASNSTNISSYDFSPSSRLNVSARSSQAAAACVAETVNQRAAPPVACSANSSVNRFTVDFLHPPSTVSITSSQTQHSSRRPERQDRPAAVSTSSANPQSKQSSTTTTSQQRDKELQSVSKSKKPQHAHSQSMNASSGAAQAQPAQHRKRPHQTPTKAPIMSHQMATPYFPVNHLMTTTDDNNRTDINLSDSIFDINTYDNYYYPYNSGYMQSSAQSCPKSSTSAAPANAFWPAQSAYENPFVPNLSSDSSSFRHRNGPEPQPQSNCSASYQNLDSTNRHSGGFSFQLTGTPANNSSSRSKGTNQSSQSGTFHIANMLPEVSQSRSARNHPNQANSDGLFQEYGAGSAAGYGTDSFLPWAYGSSQSYSYDRYRQTSSNYGSTSTSNSVNYVTNSNPMMGPILSQPPAYDNFSSSLGPVNRESRGSAFPGGPFMPNFNLGPNMP